MRSAGLRVRDGRRRPGQGKLADFTVLDGDYMTVPEDEIKDLRSVMTVVGGDVVYSEN